jgi:hypothetical protein
MSRKHAEHYEAVCDFIHAGEHWPDWVVTTAFYSALHYVRSIIFPLTEGESTYQNFDEYCASQSGYGRLDKHQLLASLVFTHLRPAFEAYEFLMNASRKSRYNGYDIPPALADKARNHLRTIKSCA